MSHVVFLGGTRFIGHAAVSHARARGHDVTVLHRGNTARELEGVREVLVDRDDPSALARAMASAAPDVVVDTRAMTRAHAEATALALRITRAPVIVLSSQDVYAQFGTLNGLPGPPPEATVTEDSPLTVPKPFAGLGEHEGGPEYDKKDVESVFAAFARDTGLACVALRLPAVYGPRDPKRRFGSFVDAFDRGEREVACVGGGSFRLTHVHVADAAHAVVLAAEAAGRTGRGSTAALRGGELAIFNVGEREVPTMRERTASIAKVMGVDVTFREVDGPLTGEASLLGVFPNDCVMDTSRIREQLAFSEVMSQEEALADLVTALRASRAAQF